MSELITITDPMRVYIIDSHRPLHLDNIVNNNLVCVFDDDDEEDKMVELIEVYEELFVSA